MATRKGQPTSVAVTIGIADGREEQVPIARFQKAWKTNDFRMVLTENTHK